MRMRLFLLVVGTFLGASYAFAQGAQLTDAYPEKSRFAPSEPVNLVVEVNGQPQGTERLAATVWRLGKAVGECGSVQLAPGAGNKQMLRCSLPPEDFQGYLATVRLTDANGRLLGERQTAIDVSSDWKRFPRYGYLAHYNPDEGTKPQLWINELNRFHINGLEFYDFQYRHDQPLAGTIAHPAPSWKDIAARTIDAATVTALIDQAHRYNMMAMAYNASYSAYDDVFIKQHAPLPLQWGTWKTPDGERSAATAKNLPLQATNWSTRYLFYMNQNDLGWQRYLFGQMHDLLEVYPFDGWHIDTFGEKGAYAFDGSYVDYIAGLPSYIDHASVALHKRIVLNAVNTMGQQYVARSAAEFVYSELWEDHETFASLLETTEQVHLANPQAGFVIAAYVNRRDAQDRTQLAVKQFNLPSVLLTDAGIFASGAAHIELGDGDRMLSSEYFPADTCTTVSPALHDSLRPYYDYLTAYENYLRDGVTPAVLGIEVSGQLTDELAVPNTLWTIARQKGDMTMVHLINLLGSDDPHWRDLDFNRPNPPLLETLQVQIASPKTIRSVGWASPDVDGGQFHSIPFQIHKIGNTAWIKFTLPELHYWDTVFLSQ
jgi:dextranase